MEWQLVDPDLRIVRYHSAVQHVPKSGQPILMLHGTLASHRSWEVLAEHLWGYGVCDLYAVDQPETQLGALGQVALDHLAEVASLLLDQLHPDADNLILIAHGAGGTLAYRYWQTLEDAARLSFLIMLAAPHDSTVFPMLGEHLIQGSLHEGATGVRATRIPAVDFSKIKAVHGPSSTVLINIMGNQYEPDFDAIVRGVRSTMSDDRGLTHAVGPTFDGTVRSLHLPEAVNLVLPLRKPLGHTDVNKSARVGDTVIACLQGEYFQVKLRLVGLRLRGEGEYSGPVAFEINGNHMPPDTVFHGITDHLYLFEEHVPPICTLGYPLNATSATITLHLKDLSDHQGRRRRMYTRLHIPLHEDNSTTHTMQDSEGSDYLWRIVTQRMPVALEDPMAPEKPRVISRGI